MKKINLTNTWFFIILLFCVSMTIQTQAAPGDLDPSFGNGGKVVTSIGNGDEGASAVAIQSDGKIVAVGGGNNGANNGTLDDFELARYNTDGSLDVSFGTGGKVVTSVGASSYAYAVAIQADGKIIAAGFRNNGASEDFTVVRYNINGSLDSTFGVDGIVVTTFNFYDSYAQAVAIQTDGKIVAAGYVYTGNLSNFALARYNTNGSLDTSFGSGGIRTTQFYPSSGSSDVARAVVIQTDGKIVAAGLSNLNDYGNSFALARYNTDGSLDTSFGLGGKVTTSAGGSEAGFSDVAIQSDGKIVAVGCDQTIGIRTNFFLARYNTDGSLDTTFGTGGKVGTLVGASSSAGGVAIQADGKIVIAGYSLVGGIYHSALARYNTNGSLDITFGTNGIVVTPIGDYYGGSAGAVAIQPDGKIVTAGFSFNGATQNFALVRYLGDSNTRRTQFDFDGDGKADITVFRPSNGNWYLNQSTNGFSAAQFGIATDKLVPADYDGDGKTDIAVFREGFWYWLNSSNNQFNAVQFGQAGDIPVPADYTGDGRAELAVFRSGFWYSLNLAANQFQSTQFGLAADKPVAADYDGDGKADIAVVRQSEGKSIWYVAGSSRGFYGFQFGNDTDKLVPADYDGDDKTDFAVFRPSDGNWYIWCSSTNSLQTVNWGLASDSLVPADYDGDGKADITVYRNGIWYIRQSTSGINYSYFGAGGDVPTNQVQ